MPTDPVRARGRRPVWAVLVAGAAGVAALAALAAAGWAEPQPALTAGLVVAGVAALLAVVLASQAPPPPASLIANAPAERAALPYRDLIDALPEPVMVVAARERDDPVGRRFVLVNAAASALLGLQRTEGLVVTVLRHPDVLATLDAALFDGAGGEAEYESAGGRILRVAARPLSPAGDGARRALLTFHDDTERHRIERTRVDFLANASHELRTPLASLAGFIETLRGPARDDPAAQARFLDVMQTQADRMARLVDDLMSLSRIELVEHIAPSGEADLAAVARETADGLAPQAKAGGVKVAVDAPAGPVAVLGERDQIVQVAQNLLENALKYSPEGGTVRLAVALHDSAEAAAAPRDPDAVRLPLIAPEAGARPFASLTVSDEGPGIARENLPRLTERFYRVEGQKSGARLGTGLGLAIVKHILLRHGGGLVVESAPGRGSTFTAVFPRADGNATELS
jgi:two-component system, OmpR family, phosphate regulon sensor histidine kinase PhoR